MPSFEEILRHIPGPVAVIVATVLAVVALLAVVSERVGRIVRPFGTWLSARRERLRRQRVDTLAELKADLMKAYEEIDQLRADFTRRAEADRERADAQARRDAAWARWAGEVTFRASAAGLNLPAPPWDEH